MASSTPKVGPRPLLPALLVLVVGHAALILSRTYRPGGDWAFIELRTSDVFSTHSPLTGAWSRYGWNHPGPFLYDALALPRLLTSGSWRGLWLGAMLLNLAAIAVAWWAIGRRSRAMAGVWVAAGCWTLLAATPHLLTDPWNASVVVLPMLTVGAAVVATRSGDRLGVAVAMITAVAVAQTHAAYGVMLLPSLVVVLVVGWRRWRRWTLAWIGGAAALCLPILVDTLVHWPGNLWRALRFTATSEEPAVALTDVARVIGRSSSLTFFTSPGLPSFAAVVGDTPWGVLPFLALVAAGGAWWTAHRRGWTVWCLALEAVGLLWLGGAAMTWRTRGPLLVWLTTWTAAVAALTWCLVIAVAARAVGTHLAGARFGATGTSSLPLDLTAERGVDAATDLDAETEGATAPHTTTEAATTMSDPGLELGAEGTTNARTTASASSRGITAHADATSSATTSREKATASRSPRSPSEPDDSERPHVNGVRVDRWLALFASAAALSFAVVDVVGSIGVGYPFQEFTPVVEQFADAAEPFLDRPTLIALAGPEYEAGAVQSALIAELDLDGRPALGLPSQALQLGDHRVAGSTEGRRLLVQVEPRSAPPAGAELVSTWDPLAPAERAEADALVDALTELLEAAGLDDRLPLLANQQAPLAALEGPAAVTDRRPDFERLGELHARGPRIVLYLVPA